MYQFLENLRLDLEDMQSLLLEVAGVGLGFRVVISRVISPLIWIISTVTLLITTHEPLGGWELQEA